MNTYKSFCFTGTLEMGKRYTAGLWALEAGYNWSNKLSSTTTHLVVGKQNPKCLAGDNTRSSKERAADHKPNINVITEEVFKKLVGYKPFHQFSYHWESENTV